jgi:hypothetical protein
MEDISFRSALAVVAAVGVAVVAGAVMLVIVLTAHNDPVTAKTDPPPRHSVMPSSLPPSPSPSPSPSAAPSPSPDPAPTYVPPPAPSYVPPSPTHTATRRHSPSPSPTPPWPTPSWHPSFFPTWHSATAPPGGDVATAAVLPARRAGQ